MPNNILSKISKADLKYLKENFPEELKSLEKGNIADLSSKNLPSEVTRVLQKNDNTIQLEQKPQLTQEQALNPEPPDTRSQVEKVVDQLHNNPQELAAKLTELSKNNPNMGDQLMTALEKHPGLAQGLSSHMPQLQVAQNPPRWVSDNTASTAQVAQEQQVQASQPSFGL